MELAKQKIIDGKAQNLSYIASRMQHQQDEIILAAHRLSLNLQQTLNIEALITAFCAESVSLIPCASVAYRNDSLKLFIYHGDKEQHLCRYSLEIEKEKLGEIECTSARPFTEQELMRLEHLLSVLVFPLRNALMYNLAVQSAKQDPLTRLFNRAAFNEMAESEVSRATRQCTGLCMLVLDIDHFKSINDNYGHLMGDEVLKEIATRLKLSLRTEDHVFRYGGEEFVILLSATDLPSARLTAERIRMMVEQKPIKKLGVSLNISTSIGVTEWQRGESSSSLFQRADQALYAAKTGGRNQVKVA